MRAVTLMLWGLCVAPVCAVAADAPGASNEAGKKVFDRYCAECHAPGHGHPGTQRLGWSKGEASAILEKRRDLTADYVKAIVRRGLFEMPPFRPTEISDRELADLGAYLSK